MGSMKVHQFARGFWEHEPSLTLGCKRLRPLAPKLDHPQSQHHHHQQSSADSAAALTTVTPFDLKSFIRPESGPRKLGSPDDKIREPNQVDTHPGGTRWNPTQEQIGILEMLYRGGMRTPNAQQIEQITEQLGKYGKIEGKNVFYWFQNHKARERQKQKRNNTLALNNNNNNNNNYSPRTAAAAATITITNPLTHDLIRGSDLVIRREEDSPYKRKCRSWTFECLQEEEEEKKLYCRSEEEATAGDRTLELFPLHPENRS